MSYFSQSKGERDKKSLDRTDSDFRPDADPADNRSAETVSALGHGMLITGNIVCAGSMQIFGRVIGDIHAAKLIIGEGARVEGNVIAQETVFTASSRALSAPTASACRARLWSMVRSSINR